MTAHLENSTITSCNGYLQVSGLACMLFLCMFGWRQFKQVNPFCVRAHQKQGRYIGFRRELPFSTAKIQFSSSQSIKKLNIDPVQAFLENTATQSSRRSFTYKRDPRTPQPNISQPTPQASRSLCTPCKQRGQVKEKFTACSPILGSLEGSFIAKKPGKLASCFSKCTRRRGRAGGLQARCSSIHVEMRNTGSGTRRAAIEEPR